MTETVVEAPQMAQDATEGDPGTSGSPEAPEGSQSPEAPRSDKAKLSSEAARWRTSFREAEAKLAEAQSRVEALQRAEAERLAGELAAPADLWEIGQVSLAELLDEAGNVDSAAVAESVAALIESRPGLAKNPKVLAVDHTQGTGSNPGKGQLDWADLFKPST